MGRVRHIQVVSEFAGQRVDNYLRRELKGVPKTLIYRLLRKGEVRVNGGRIRAHYRLQSGDELRLPPVRTGDHGEMPASASVRRRLEASILYEDATLLVIDKPSGMAVHGGSGLAYGVVEAFRELRPNVPFLDLAHRLDRDTSGCLMIAKRRSVLRHIHALLREGRVSKRYLALVRGEPSNDVMPVSLPLVRQTGAGGESVMRVSQTGKPSQTVFRALQRYAGWTLIEADLRSGRMHQIRVHAAHLGHPVAGDRRYGDEHANRDLRRHGLRRLFLHAAQLGLTLDDGRRIDVRAPLPVELRRVLWALSDRPITSHEGQL